MRKMLLILAVVFSLSACAPWWGPGPGGPGGGGGGGGGEGPHRYEEPRR